MQVYFVVVETTLTCGQLAGKRRRLARLLHKSGVELCCLRAGSDGRSIISRIISQARGSPLVALDDVHGLPDAAPWLADLTRDVMHLLPARRPQVLYVTQRTSAAGLVQALRHPVVRHYIKRDDKGRWIESVVEAVSEMLQQGAPAELVAQASAQATVSDIVGAAPCFRQAVEELYQVMQTPYGLVTGDPGVGKLFLIRALWRQMSENPRMIVLPCGSFFKDYYVSGIRRRFGGGREAVDQLGPYLDEAEDGLLVLHHVEQLPTALQDELVARLSSASGDPRAPSRLVGVDRGRLHESDVKIIATSNLSPELLEKTGRIIPELARKLLKRYARIPSLSERGPEDVQLLCEDVVRRIALRQAQAAESKGSSDTPPPPRISPEVVRVLAKRPWQYNMSDLLRVLEHAVRKCRGGTIRLEHLPKDIASPSALGSERSLDNIVVQAQRAAIQNALEQTGGDVPRTSAILGRHKHALYRLMGKLGITIPREGRADRHRINRSGSRVQDVHYAERQKGAS